MELIKETVMHNRPNLAPQSYATYASTLKGIYDKTFDDEKYKLANLN